MKSHAVAEAMVCSKSLARRRIRFPTVPICDVTFDIDRMTNRLAKGARLELHSRFVRDAGAVSVCRTPHIAGGFLLGAVTSHRSRSFDAIERALAPKDKDVVRADDHCGAHRAGIDSGKWHEKH